MTKKSSGPAKSQAALFIGRRIYELQSRKSQADIASAAGFKSPGMLSMIKDGKSKLPIERAVPLAHALECDPAKLVRLALEQSYSASLIDQIFAPGGVTSSSVGKGMKEATDDAPLPLGEGGQIPPTTCKGAGEISPHPSEMEITLMLLGVEVNGAQHDLRIGRQFLTHVITRSERASKRLSTIGRELSAMLEIIRRDKRNAG